MANLKISVEEVEKRFTVTVKITNDVGIDSVIDSMKELFEIEMFSAEVTKGNETSSIVIKTDSEHKCNILKRGMNKVFLSYGGIDNLNEN